MSLGVSKIPLGVSIYTYSFFYLLIFVLYLGNKNDSEYKELEKRSINKLLKDFKDRIRNRVVTYN